MTFNKYTYPNFFTREDWGLVSSLASESTDLGTVTSTYTDKEDYGLVTVTGDIPEEFATELDADGISTESRAFAYGEQLIDSDVFSTDDYGEDLVSTPTYEDYGSINNAINEEEDYGSINVTETLNSFGFFTISGDAVDVLEAQKAYVGISSIEISGALVERSSFNYVGIVTGNFSGSLTERNTFSYVGVGTFSAISGAAEAFGANPPEEDVLFTVSGTGSQKLIAIPPQSIVVGTFSGDRIEKAVSDYVGIVTANFSGDAIYKFNQAYSGVGTFSSFDSLIERITYDYNESSIEFYLTPEDFGGIGSTVTSIDDYGSISDSSYEGQENYGPIGIAATSLPFGTITISGEAETIRETQNIHIADGTIDISGSLVERNTFSYIGLGTFSAITGAAEAFGANPPEDDVLFIVSGSLVERRTQSYVGLGTGNFSGSLTEKFVANPREDDVNITISGSLVEKSTFDYVGVGTFSAISGAAEAFGANPPEDDLLFNVSGEKVEKRTYSYKEPISDLFTTDDYGEDLVTTPTYEDYGLINNVVIEEEDYGSINVSETLNPYGLFTISGEAETSAEIENIFVSDGTINISGALVERSAFNYVGIVTGNFSGALVEKSTFDYVGVGTFSAISGAAEAFGANPPEEDVLFTVSGALTERKTQSYVGLGTANFSGALVERSVFNYVGLGTANFSGSLTERNTFSYVGVGTFSAISGAAEAFGANPPEDDVLFIVSGSLVEKKTQSYVGLGTGNFSGSLVERNTFSYVGVGTFSAFSGAAEVFTANPLEEDVTITISGEKIEKRTYSYKEPISDLFTTDDYGEDLVSTPTYEDYGSIDNIVIEEEDYGSINVSETLNPYGLFTISGDAVDVLEAQKAYVGISSIEISGALTERKTQSYVGLGTANFSGSLVERNTFSYVGLGTFSAISGAAEAFGANPPEDDVLFIVSGALTERKTQSYVGIVTGNFSGSLVEKNTFSYVGVGTALFSGESINSFLPTYVGIVTGNFSGSLVERNTFSYVGLGTFSAITGAAEAFGANPPEDDVLFTLSGSLVEKRSRTYIGLGTFSAFSGAAEVFTANPPEEDVTITISGEKVERRTYSYKEPITNDVFSTDDYGEDLVTTPTYEDYGSIDNAVNEEEDYGSINVNETLNPYGLFTISGDAIDVLEAQKTYVGIVTGDFSGALIEKRARSYVGIVTGNFSGSLVERNTFSYVGLGTFSTFGGLVESFGANPPEDTRLFTFSGDAETQVFGAKVQIGLGTIFISGNAIERISDDYVGIETSVSIDGSLVFKQTYSYVGLGTFSSFDGLVESFTYDYNESSIEFYLTPEDFGGIGSTVTSIDDYGSITDSTGANQENYGPIGIAATSLPFGTITISGAGTQSFTPTTYIASGTATFSGDRIERSAFNYVGVDTATFSGSLVERNTFSYVGVGTFSAISGAAEAFGANPPEEDVLFTVSGALTERKTQSYVGEPNIIIESIDQLGIGITPGEYEDFGFITSESTSEEDSGPISVSAIIFSANSSISFTPATYIGSGSFSAFGGAAEVFTANPPEDDLLFNVSGEKVERRTYSYKEPITNDLFSTDDYGEDLVSTPTYEDYGLINNVVIEEEDYGSINVNETLNPYGLFTISGSADAPRAFDYVGSGSIVIDGIGGERFLPEIYEGSGSINISGSAVEVFSANPPEDTRLFTVSGNALDVKLISSYVGFTSISISGQALQRTFQSYVGFTSISIDGFAKESFTPATYIGSGSFSVFGGAAEVFGANPPEDDVLFTVSGSLSERRVHSYVGFTSIFISGEASDIEFAGEKLFEGSGTINISGERVEKSTFSYIGSGSFSAFGGTAESITSNPLEEDVLFTISGAAETREIAVYTYAGSGTADFSGQSTDRFISSYIGSTEIQIDINSRESFTPATYVGSGSFSIFGGASQVLGANPPEDTRLFTISGNALNVKLTSAYVGFTSISISGQADEIVNVLKEHTGVGTIFINGSASESFSPATYDGLTNIQINGSLRESFTPATYIGAGSFSAFSGAAEVITSNPPEEDVLFTISGALTEKKTKSYIGLGTFSAITGAAEAFGANPPEDDVLFTVSGALTEKKTQSYVGIGAFSSFGSSSESVAFNPAEDTRLFTLSGDANTRFIGQFTEVGIGTIIANGSANPVKLISSYIGAGSFSAFGGAGEVIGANPSEGDVLFTIFGSASETFSRATYVGLVTATFSGVGIAVTNPFVPGIVFVQII